MTGQANPGENARSALFGAVAGQVYLRRRDRGLPCARCSQSSLRLLRRIDAGHEDVSIFAEKAEVAVP